MTCLNCNDKFELQQKGSGGNNRIFCYNCLPINSDRILRNKARAKLLTDYSDRVKLARGCDHCGYNRCAKALDWHHFDESTKDIDPADAVRRSLNRYLREIEKCVLLCSNCHREVHSL